MYWITQKKLVFSLPLGSCATSQSSSSPAYVLSCAISNHGPAFLESMKILSMSLLRSLPHTQLHLLFTHCFTPSPSRTPSRVRQAFTQQLYHLSPRQRHNNYFPDIAFTAHHSLFASHIFPCIFLHSFSTFPPSLY